MTLSNQLIHQVSRHVQQQGLQLFARGVVQIVEGDATWTEAEVRDRPYCSVTLLREKTTLRYRCDCRQYQESLNPCKHVWATILAAEAKGYLVGRGKSNFLDLQPDDEDLPNGEDEYDLDEGWEEDNDWNNRQGAWDPYRRVPPKAKRKPDWKHQLAGLAAPSLVEYQKALPPGREILYVVDVGATMLNQKALVVEVAYRERKKDGAWSKPRPQAIAAEQIANLRDPADRQILALLAGARGQDAYGYSYSPYYYSSASRFQVSAPLQEALLPSMCRTGRCLLRRSAEDQDLPVLRWNDGGPWEFWLTVSRADKNKHFLLGGELRRSDERMSLSEPVLLVDGGLVLWGDQVAPLQDFGAFPWIAQLRQQGPMQVPLKQQDEFLQRLLEMPNLPRLDLPEELRFEEVTLAPRPRLKVGPPRNRGYGGPQRLRGQLLFDYDAATVAAEQPGRGLFQVEQRRRILRDPEAERAAAALLTQLGFRRPTYGYQNEGLELAPRNLSKVVKTLLEAGWQVEAEGKLYRKPGGFHIEVSSGIDWFELHGSVDFGDTKAQLPQLLAALKRGESTVQLDDGTFGMLPEEWLKKYGLLAGLGTAHGDHLRFQRSQAGLLDALLASQPEATYDETFNRAREELRRFEGIQPADPPAGFAGQLRGYQCDGLGWLYFLQQFGFGGCLADDMGLGKTVQVLALLESRRELRAKKSSSANGAAHRPAASLVVVPRSLVFNWQQEAARFTPELRVLNHTGIARAKSADVFDNYDLVLTTYGTLRRDALLFKDVAFDYCILDESQAIKNASTDSAKAVRLLRGDHRLALSGTPVENHLGELWSLFEFLNPGMLGSASVFKLGGLGARNPDPETRTLLAKALRPFILRRTKAQVATDLPQKTEQTLYCELEPEQRKQYDELRAYYRQSLLAKIETDGINRAKILILEALLRLRQLACHPGLIDKRKVAEPSAKLDMLLPQLAEVTEEDHKVLVFSQFTSLLAIVRARLDQEKIPYEYLDGRTRDRKAKVERFQNDPDCKLFLISLKAGGLGLNLTAAEYVFLLDPWWNPAVEAQAIDRAHRIGQTKPVFAYRLIARDTVEEKVLELQKTKRDLADAIINADNSLIRSLGRDDVELLLS